MRDLVILVPGRDDKAVVEAILYGMNSGTSRPRRGRNWPIDFVSEIHPRRDPGCFHEAHLFLRRWLNVASHALVVFDREGCGQEARQDRDALEESVEDRLCQNGWRRHQVCAVVIDPELEVWAYGATSPPGTTMGEFNQWSERCGAPLSANGKPHRPKELLYRYFEEKQIPKSSALYGEMAIRARWDQCRDPAFAKLHETLRSWFADN